MRETQSNCAALTGLPSDPLLFPGFRSPLPRDPSPWALLRRAFGASEMPLSFTRMPYGAGPYETGSLNEKGCKPDQGTRSPVFVPGWGFSPSINLKRQLGLERGIWDKPSPTRGGLQLKLIADPVVQPVQYSLHALFPKLLQFLHLRELILRQYWFDAIEYLLP